MSPNSPVSASKPKLSSFESRTRLTITASSWPGSPFHGGLSQIGNPPKGFPFEKDSLARASEKYGLIIDLFYYSEKLGYFHRRAIAALRPAKAAFHGTVSTEKDN